MPIVIPIRGNSLRSDAAGFHRLASLSAELTEVPDGEEVQLDCKSLAWMDADLGGPLQTINRHARTRGLKLAMHNLSEPIRQILQKNGTLKARIEDTYHTTIPITPFGLDDGVTFSLFAQKHLARSEMPRMTEALRGKFFEGVDELFANSSLHSKSAVGVVCSGQFYPQSGRLTFVLSDGGRGIDGALAAAGHSRLTAEDAIQWAMEPYNTTRQGDVPGGLGSKLLREFVAMNGGRLLVVSGDGYWCQSAKNVEKSRMPHRFPGTVVALEISTTDTNLYDFAKSPDPRDIW